MRVTAWLRSPSTRRRMSIAAVLVGCYVWAMVVVGLSFAMEERGSSQWWVIPLFGAFVLAIAAAAGLYFVHRIWTYLVFAPDRLDFAAAEHSTAVLTAAEKEQFIAALHLGDPRWILNLMIFAVFLLSAFFARLRELRQEVLDRGTDIAEGLGVGA